jgi:hypothetical protein
MPSGTPATGTDGKNLKALYISLFLPYIDIKLSSSCGKGERFVSEDYGHEPPQLGESSVVMCNEETLRIGVHEGAFYPKAAEWLLVPLL